MDKFENLVKTFVWKKVFICVEDEQLSLLKKNDDGHEYHCFFEMSSHQYHILVERLLDCCTKPQSDWPKEAERYMLTQEYHMTFDYGKFVIGKDNNDSIAEKFLMYQAKLLVGVLSNAIYLSLRLNEGSYSNIKSLMEKMSQKKLDESANIVRFWKSYQDTSIAHLSHREKRNFIKLHPGTMMALLMLQHYEVDKQEKKRKRGKCISHRLLFWLKIFFRLLFWLKFFFFTLLGRRKKEATTVSHFP